MKCFTSQKLLRNFHRFINTTLHSMLPASNNARDLWKQRCHLYGPQYSTTSPDVTIQGLCNVMTFRICGILLNQYTKFHCQTTQHEQVIVYKCLLPEAVCCLFVEYVLVQYTCVPNFILIGRSIEELYAQTLYNKFLLPEAVSCCLQNCNCWFVEYVHLCTKFYCYRTQYRGVIGTNINNRFLLPEPVCYCLQTCNYEIQAYVVY